MPCRPIGTSRPHSAASRHSSNCFPRRDWGAWAEFKTVQLNPKTALSGKEKELIGLAVAAQIPCSYCIYFHTEAAKLNGATDAEIREAVAMAAISRHWSTVLNGMQADPAGFRQETDTVLHLAAERMKAVSAKQ
jgi:AhpD family alkylhydroperoxidase